MELKIFNGIELKFWSSFRVPMVMIIESSHNIGSMNNTFVSLKHGILPTTHSMV